MLIWASDNGCIVPVSNTLPHGLGSFSEYTAAPENTLAIKPVNLGFEEAAAVPLAAAVALQGLRDKGLIQQGEKVLVNGASGGNGTFAVQIAKKLHRNSPQVALVHLDASKEKSPALVELMHMAVDLGLCPGVQRRQRLPCPGLVSERVQGSADIRPDEGPQDILQFIPFQVHSTGLKGIIHLGIHIKGIATRIYDIFAGIGTQIKKVAALHGAVGAGRVADEKVYLSVDMALG